MNQEIHVLGLKSMEKLILHQGYVICQQSGKKITLVDDLTTVHLGVGDNQFVLLPVHKENAKWMLQALLGNFSKGLPPLDDREFHEFHWRE